MNNKKDIIKDFIYRFVRNQNLGDDENFFESEAVNSLFAMQLIMFLESEFSISIKNDELDIENFNTINSIVNFVENKSEVKK